MHVDGRERGKEKEREMVCIAFDAYRTTGRQKAFIIYLHINVVMWGSSRALLVPILFYFLNLFTFELDHFLACPPSLCQFRHTSVDDPYWISHIICMVPWIQVSGQSTRELLKNLHKLRHWWMKFCVLGENVKSDLILHVPPFSSFYYCN